MSNEIPNARLPSPTYKYCLITKQVNRITIVFYSFTTAEFHVKNRDIRKPVIFLAVLYFEFLSKKDIDIINNFLCFCMIPYDALTAYHIIHT